MRIPLTLSAVLLASQAVAAGAPIRTLLTGSGGQVGYGSRNFVVVKRTSDLKRFELAVLPNIASGNRIQDLMLAVKSSFLTSTEMDLFRGNAAFVATRCFGLPTAQLPALNTWITAQNRAGTARLKQTFGNLTVIYVNQKQPPYSTLELYREDTTPGASGWVNYCTV